MSKKGGGSVSGRGGGGASSKLSGGGGGFAGRDSHFKGAHSDAKYGMLLWNCKLQERFLKEQKKQKEETRRKSDEGQYPKRAQVISRPTAPLRVGSGSDRVPNPNTPNSKANGGQDALDKGNSNTGESKTGSPLHNGEGERRIEISRESHNPGGFYSAQPPTPIISSDARLDRTEKFSDREYNYDYDTTSGNRVKGPGPSTANANFRPPDSTLTLTNPYPILSNNSDHQNQKQSYFQSDAIKQTHSSKYRSQSQSKYQQGQNYSEEALGSPGIPTLPRIGPVTVPPIQQRNQMTPKMGNSVSCDNFSKSQQNLSSSPYTFSTNLAFFGLDGFGSGTGAGAPRRTPSGRLITNLQGHPDIRYHQKDTRGFDQTMRYMMDKDRTQQYKEDLDKQIIEKERQRKSSVVCGPIKIMSSHESNQNLNIVDDYNYGQDQGERETFSNWGWNGNGNRRVSKNCGVELAPIIRKYKSMPKLPTLSSTDVTKSFVSSPRKGAYCFSPEPEELRKGLSIQLAEKQKMQQNEVESEKQAAEQHFSTWDSFWGRPGHGAPMFFARNSRLGASTPSLVTSRSDLFKALHMTHQNQGKKK